MYKICLRSIMTHAFKTRVNDTQTKRLLRTADLNTPPYISWYTILEMFTAEAVTYETTGLMGYPN